MTHRVTRHPGPLGSTFYEARTDLHRITIRSPFGSRPPFEVTDTWHMWGASVYLYGFALSRSPEHHHIRAATPAAAAAALLDLLPPHHRAEIAPALQAILDAPALEPTP